jgi:hypothetical protein
MAQNPLSKAWFPGLLVPERPGMSSPELTQCRLNGISDSVASGRGSTGLQTIGNPVYISKGIAPLGRGPTAESAADPSDGASMTSLPGRCHEAIFSHPYIKTCGRCGLCRAM